MAHLIDFPSLLDIQWHKICLTYTLYYALAVSGGRGNPVLVIFLWLEEEGVSARWLLAIVPSDWQFWGD